MPSHRVRITVAGRDVATLADILPPVGPIAMLIVGKTPALTSVAAGHYWQGDHGKKLWKKLKEWELLDVPAGSFEDDVLVDHNYGITDVVKTPRSFGNEPSDDEYRRGIPHILALVRDFQPRVVMFVYKRALDKLLSLHFQLNQKAVYGFNENLRGRFGARVFVFPMPGTPCSTPEALIAMEALAKTIRR